MVGLEATVIQYAGAACLAAMAARLFMTEAIAVILLCKEFKAALNANPLQSRRRMSRAKLHQSRRKESERKR